MIDMNYLRSLSPDDGMAYLRQALAGGIGQYVPGGEGSGFGEGAVPGEPGYYSGLGRGVNVISGYEGYGPLSEYDGVAPGTRRQNQALIEGPGGRSYVATFDDAGNLTDVGQQMADSWYDKEVLGVPIGAFLPIAAAAAAAYAPGLLGEGAAGTAGNAGTVTLSNADLAAMGIGGTPESVVNVAATLGESAVPSGLGSGTFGMGAGYTTPSLAALEAGTLPALTPGMTAAGYSALPSATALGAGTAGLATGAGAGGAMSFLDASQAAIAAGAPAGSGSALPSWLRTISDAVGGPRALGALAGGAIGALTSGDKQTQTSATKDPWGPAQPWLKDLIAEGQKLQGYYRQNPFNEQQKTGYANLFATADGFNQSVPGLLGWANGWMSGANNYVLPGQTRQTTAPAFQAPTYAAYGTPTFANPYSLLG